ncbi:hypothetical protein RHSIM_Rhsim09G0085900 [Rhododendron simsii]|uniref:Uncharacterized protein n=1 Tax=Rhododendron simsii TaxID=118357 RepID=A0A834GG82_RHOSS|nr:hypothetical protein RHSIM_Rhsim09G0085900 [Rhododendron simsii]
MRNRVDNNICLYQIPNISLRCKYNLSLPFKDKLAFSPRQSHVQVIDVLNHGTLRDEGEYHRYIAEFKVGDGRNDAAKDTMNSYMAA